MKHNFIRVSDKDTIDKLLKLGFQIVDKSSEMVTFLNSDKIHFSNDVNISKIQYSNMLSI